MAEAASRTCELDGEETKLLTWSTKSTKLLISLRRENDDLFAKGKVRKNVAWQRIAEKFNLTSSVKVTGEQCSNKWKKLEDKYKKVKEHNDKTGNDRKECDFQQELEEFFGTDPKIIPTATVSSLTAKPATGNTSTDDEEELPLASCREPPKKKKKRRSKSSATEMIEFLTEYKEEKGKEEEAKIVLAQKMHNEKMGIMERDSLTSCRRKQIENFKNLKVRFIIFVAHQLLPEQVSSSINSVKINLTHVK